MSIQVERNQEATVYIGNLDERVTVPLLWELMVQAGPVVNVHIPKDRVTQMMQGYGFCEFQTEEDATYAANIMNMFKLFGKPIRVNKALADKKPVDVGANLFISNLDPDVDEKMLYDTFASFGPIVITPRIARDTDSGNSRGFAFISYGNFEASDAAIEAMDSQYLSNKKISVNYALKKDGKGERHGSAAERLLASQAKKNQPQTEYPGAAAYYPAMSNPNPMYSQMPAYPPNNMNPYSISGGYTAGYGSNVAQASPGIPQDQYLAAPNQANNYYPQNQYQY
ncbi:hypothetical protein BB561_002001 [Smittium simulii]|uniref:Splicing factor 3B subunit 4 n=1 Tax=Smittium simulii TaxID=133385 RepID=A0A2T9YS56_9FUNG|nr:hypothetical protein BB561_002001 [Smittium simulii]